MFNNNQKFLSISSQAILAMGLILGFQSVAYGQSSKNFTPSYKVERCDCFGFSEDIPTFLSDLPGTDGMDIFGEGKTLKDAEKNAQNMCIESYRNFASLSNKEHPESVTHSGCKKLKTAADGQWVSI